MNGGEGIEDGREEQIISSTNMICFTNVLVV